MIRRDDEGGTTTDGADSIYNPHYSIHSLTDVKTKKLNLYIFELFF
jgi:hypothetical protein